MIVEAIHSGGQRGADQGGLGAAVTLDLRTGGWAPKGYRTETGPALFLAQLGLREHTSPEYPPRTRLNVEETDGTFIFGNSSSPGCKLTCQFAQGAGKSVLILPWRQGDASPFEFEIARFRRWVQGNDIRVLNVAGNRESKNPGITRAVYSFLVAAVP